MMSAIMGSGTQRGALEKLFSLLMGLAKALYGQFILSVEVNQSWANSKKQKGQRNRKCKTAKV